MDNEYIAVKIDDDCELLIQQANVNTHKNVNAHKGEVLAAAGSKIESTNMKDFLDKTIPQIKRFTAAVKDKLKSEIDESSPDELVLEFSLGVSAELKPVIGGVGISKGITVHLKWENKDKK